MAWTDWQSMGSTGEVLWTNSNPSAMFKDQAISIPDNIASVIIVYNYSTDDNRQSCLYMDDAFPKSIPSYNNKTRTISFKDDGSEISFSENTGENKCIIPYKIIGFKKALIKA